MCIKIQDLSHVYYLYLGMDPLPPPSPSQDTGESQGHLPIIDIGPLWREDSSDDQRQDCIRSIGQACRYQGFFYIINHGVDAALELQLEEVAKEYFLLPDQVKREISMARGGLAWRGSFLVGDELTSGIPDQKEGVYYGEEVEPEEGVAPSPLRGRNLFHDSALGHRMREVILCYMADMRRLGDLLLRALAASLGLSSSFFGNQFHSPTQLFRMFHYPPHNPAFGPNSQAVGEHTDYGYLTILKQDMSGGLKVKSNDAWIDATPVPHSFVVNLGDALEHTTCGLLRATPHRVAQRLLASSSRFSFPFFYDPSFDAQMQAVDISQLLSQEDRLLAEQRRQDRARGGPGADRWDAQDPALFRGTYGQYLLKKVAKVFPLLADQHHLLSS